MRDEGCMPRDQKTDEIKSPPTFYIGLGGLGGKVLMRLRRSLVRRDIPLHEGRRFLFLDTDDRRPGIEDSTEFEYERLRPNADELVNCSISQAQFESTFRGQEHIRDPRLVDWLDPTLGYLGSRSVTYGAAMHRQVGRLALMMKAERIYDALRSHLVSLADEVRYRGVRPRLRNRPFQIVLVTSLAGGTGSGMFLDVAYMLRDMGKSREPWLPNAGFHISLVAVLPEVFECYLGGGEHRKQLRINGQAALMELSRLLMPRETMDPFVGAQSADDVVFRAPWKTGDGVVSGPPFDDCFLIDGMPSGCQTRLDAPGTCQLIADYLALDARDEGFNDWKLANQRHRRTQSLDWHETRVRALPIGGLPGDEWSDRNVVFSQWEPCSFSSFGLAEIEVDRKEGLRALGARLAAQLIQIRWLGHAKETTNESIRIQLSQAFAGERHGADEMSPFDPIAIMQSLLFGEHGGTLSRLAAELSAAATLAKPGEKLRSLVEEFRAELASVKKPSGAAASRFDVLAGDERTSGSLRQCIREVVRAAVSRDGIVVARRWQVAIRECVSISLQRLRSLSRAPAESADDLLRALAAAENAFRLWRGRAVRRVLPRVVEGLHSALTHEAWLTVASDVERILRSGDEFVRAGGGPQEERLLTLEDYCVTAERLARQLMDRLLNFPDLPRRHDEDRNLILPLFDDASGEGGRWIESVIRSQRHLLEDDGSVAWNRVQDIVLRSLEARLGAFPGGDWSLPDLLDKCVRSPDRSDVVAALAVALKDACANLLAGSRHDNSVALESPAMLRFLETVVAGGQNGCVARLVTMSGPARLGLALPGLDPESSSYVASLLGLPRTSPRESPQLEHAFCERLESENKLNGETSDGAIDRIKLQSTESVVLLRERRNLPLSSYDGVRSLDSSDWRSQTNRWSCILGIAPEDLFDFHLIGPQDYEFLRDHAENVILGITLRSIGVDSQGRHQIECPTLGATYTFGRRLGQFVRECCTNNKTRHLLSAKLANWESRATPVDWAAAMIALQLTTADCTRQVFAPAAISPLSNCCHRLLHRISLRLQETQVGQRWLSLLQPPAVRWDEAAERASVRKNAIRELQSHDAILPGSPLAPVYRVGANVATHLRFELFEVSR